MAAKTGSSRCRRRWRRAAVLAGLAVAIEILIMSSVRRQNLAEIRISFHLLQVGRKRHLVFREAEIKNEVAQEIELPEDTVELLDWYIVHHRRVLAKAGCDDLFPGQNGGAKRKATLGIQISKVVLKYTGLVMNPHLFRHASAKLLLDAQPGAYEVVRRRFGHKQMSTTTNFYAGAETRAANRLFNNLIVARRAEAVETAKKSAAKVPKSKRGRQVDVSRPATRKGRTAR